MLSPPPCNAISLQSKYRLDCRAVHSLGESIFLSSPPPGGGGARFSPCVVDSNPCPRKSSVSASKRFGICSESVQKHICLMPAFALSRRKQGFESPRERQ
jgi:hypothetical protein